MGNGKDEQVTNADQVAYWNSESGKKWALNQEGLDAISNQVKARLLYKAAPKTKSSVIDIGCGTGDTAISVATTVGENGHVLGIDVSSPLLDLAKQRAAVKGLKNIKYVLADAQTYHFRPHSADLVISRFGVMFFSDPVQAFKNIGTALKPGGRVVFVSWAALDQNPWFSVPRQAAIERLGEPLPSDPAAPGPLAFQDKNMVADILRAAGYEDVEAETAEIPLPFFRSLEDTALLASTVGPAARIAREFNATDADIADIAASVEKAFQSYAEHPNPSVPSRLNFFSAIKA